MEIVEEILEHMCVFFVLKIVRVILFDQVVQIGRAFGAATAAVIPRMTFAASRGDGRVAKHMVVHRHDDLVLGLQNLSRPPIKRLACDRARRKPTFLCCCS